MALLFVAVEERCDESNNEQKQPLITHVKRVIISSDASPAITDHRQ